MDSETQAAVLWEAVEVAADLARWDYAAGRRAGALTAADTVILRDVSERLARRSARILALPPREAVTARWLYGQAFGVAYHVALDDLGVGYPRDVAALVGHVRAQMA
jgi:hypothetical protein